ncbi:MAG: arginine decarboxylase [Thermoleophilaceae bacterium]|nr:arginine decarboxylase [Thermoleophilaceae bacterium]
MPGHKGGAGADPRLLDALGEQALALDIPALMWGIDVGLDPSPFEEAQRLAAEAWGAQRTWFLVNGASQGNHVALLALAHAGEEVVLQRNAHSSTIDALVLSGLRPTFAAPELDPDLHIAHCLTPETLDGALAATPDAVGAAIVSPTYFGAVADVAALAEVAHGRGVPLIVDEAWGAHLAFNDDLPAHALSLGADLVISSIHKIVGSLTQSAMVHLGHGGLIDADVVDRCVTLVESTSPNALLSASLDTARRAAAVDGQALLAETLRGLAETRAAVRAVPGLDVLDERLVGAAGVFAYDPLRMAIDVRGTQTSGYELARLLRERDDVHVELAGENVMVAVFGMGEEVSAAGERLVGSLRRAVEFLSAGERDPRAEEFAPPPPWGELAMSPRDAFLGPQEVVPVREAVGRVAAESLAAYPPGIPNVLPGERLTTETLDYIQQALDHGGSLRGASDRALRTLRVAVER